MAKRFKKAKIKDQERQLKSKLQQYCSEPGHRVPQTRREFLNAGVLALGTQILAPTFLSLVGRSAWANEIECATSAATFPAFINLQLAGGPALFANHLAHAAGGRPYDKYGLLGVGTSPKIEKYFANNAPFYAPDGVAGNGRPGSGFLRGLKERMTATQFNEIIGGESAGSAGRAVFVSVACKSVDDRLTNEHDLSGLLKAAGLGAESTLPHVLSELGGRNVTANVGKGIKRFKEAYYPGPAYLRAVSAEAMQGALGFQGALANDLGANPTDSLQLQSTMLKLVNDLNKKHIEALSLSPQSVEGRIAARKLAYCAGQVNLKNFENVQDADAFDIYKDDALATIWNRNFVDKTGSFSGEFKNLVTGQIGTTVSATLKGHAPACTLAIGGYDYHLNQLTSREGQDNHDIFMGHTVANILLTAHQLQKSVFLYISTDGSVNTPNNINTKADVAWRGDYGERGMNYIIAYHPAGTGEITTRGFKSTSGYEDGNFQLNHFEEVQEGAFKDFIVSSKNPIAEASAQDLAAAAVFLNYLEFAGLKQLIDRPQLSLVKSKLTQAAAILNSSDIFEVFSRMGKS